MAEKIVLLAIYAHIGLIIYIYIHLGNVRGAQLKNLRAQGKEEAIKPLAYDGTGWPLPIRYVQNALSSQFELPIIFYVLSLVALATGTADYIVAAFSVAFVALRFGHAYVHIQTNFVPLRYKLFLYGVYVIVAQLIYLALRTLGAF